MESIHIICAVENISSLFINDFFSAIKQLFTKF